MKTLKNFFTTLVCLLLISSFSIAQDKLVNYEFDEGDNYGDGTKNMNGQR
ncbi:MAG: hypothetical protein HUU47_08800 [Bacteroidetes bacterium]|nr:hypothetical protein [Bacteroidota bacterium]